jgi:hypothetical protein
MTGGGLVLTDSVMDTFFPKLHLAPATARQEQTSHQLLVETAGHT